MHPLQRFTHPPVTKDPASLPAPAESRQGGCTIPQDGEPAHGPIFGAVLAAAFILSVGLALSFVIALLMELAR